MLSPRNQIKSVTTLVKIGRVMTEILVRAGDIELVSVITRGQRKALSLKAGDEVTAIVQSTEVRLDKEMP